jgi:hypothetical protein
MRLFLDAGGIFDSMLQLMVFNRLPTAKTRRARFRDLDFKAQKVPISTRNPDVSA